MQSTELLEWLIKQDAQTVQAWVQQAWENPQDIPNDFNWQHLAASSDTLAKAGTGPDYYTEPDLAWADVAVSIYQYLISKAQPLGRIELEWRMMYLKAYLIMRLGQKARDPLLDINQIVTWFFHNLLYTREEAEEKSANVDKLSDEELFHLRYLKERLTILRFLWNKHLLPPDEEIEAWLAIREKLP